MTTSFINTFQIDRRLFRSEIRASLSHTDALFRAGILTRQEAERIKNGLWTVLKRAEFDRNFFDSLPSPDVFAFVEARLFQLINEASEKLKIGRSREQQAAIALRIWIREEIQHIFELLENLSELLHKPDNPMFSAFFEMIERDRELFDDSLRRVNRMPLAQINVSTNEMLAEIDFAEIARDLGFDSLAHNNLESVSDRDFCLEFVGASALVTIHLARLANEILTVFPSLPGDLREVFEAFRGKSAKIFGFHATLLSLVQNMLMVPTKDLQEINPIVFETSDVVKSCLETMLTILKRLETDSS